MSSKIHKRASTTRSYPQRTNGNLWDQDQREKNQALVRLVKSWYAEDAARDPHEVETEWEEFKQALDADRLSDRKLFP